jgi:hypothetical protein
MRRLALGALDREVLTSGCTNIGQREIPTCVEAVCEY